MDNIPLRVEHTYKLSAKQLLKPSAIFIRKTEVTQMGVNKFNCEGYYDPTAYEALTKIEQEAKALDVVLKSGAQLVKDVDKKSFQAAMQPVYAKFINTPDLQRLVKAAQDTK